MGKFKILFFIAVVFLGFQSCKTVMETPENVLIQTKETVLPTDQQRKFDYFFIEASRFKMNNDFEKAAKMLQECINIDPRSAASYFELGTLYLRTQNNEEALKYIRTAANLNPTNEWYRFYLAGIYEQSKDYENAVQQYKLLTANFPGKPEYQYRLALLLTQQKQYLDAIDIYNEIEQQNGISEPLSLEKHSLYMQAEDVKKAIKEIEKLKNEYPNQPRYYVLFGDALIDDKDFKKAFKAYNKALEIDNEYGPVYMSLAGYYELLNQPKESQKQLEKAFNSNTVPFENKLRILVQYMLQATKDSTKNENMMSLVNIMLENHPDEPDLHYYYGNYLLNQNQTDDAMEQFSQVVELDPKRYETWIQMTGIYFERQEWEKAIEVSENAIDNEPALPQAYLYNGIAHFQKENFKQALNSFLKGAIYSTNEKELNGMFYSNIGDTYYKLEKKDEAFEHYEKALELDDHNIMVLNNYSYYLSLENENLDKAAEMSAKCVQLEPGNSTYLDTYAWVLYKQKNYTLSKFYIEKAIANLAEDNGEVFDHYGDILYKTGEKEKAMDWWKKALEAGFESDTLEIKIETGELSDL